MVRPKSSSMTDYELEIMNILWEEAPLKVAEVLERLNKSPAPAYTSLMTVMQTMVKKGYLAASKEGKANYYKPVVRKNKAVVSEFKKMAKKFFNGSSKDLVVNLIENEELSSKEIADIKKILEAKNDR